MGRAVLVLLFCVAMDPIYVVLNAIPGVLSVKGYMDDNATCGAWAVALGSTTSIHIGHHGRFSGPWTLYWGLVCGECGYCSASPRPDSNQARGPSFLQALGSMPVGADVILECATRRAHLASADVADFLGGQDRLRDI